MKKLLLLLVLTIPSFAQDNFEKISYAQDTYYYGVPFFYQGGLGYQYNDFKMVLPYIGTEFVPTLQKGYSLYTGFELAYRTLVFDARFVQQLGTWKERYNLDYLKALNYYGLFSLTYSIVDLKMVASVEVGETMITNSSPTGVTDIASRDFTIKPRLAVFGVAYDNTMIRIGYKLNADFNVVPSMTNSTYHLKAYAPINFHLGAGWVQWNFLPGLEYKDFIKRNNQTMLFNDLASIYSPYQFLSDHSAPSFQFLASIGTELRFYMKFLEQLSPALSRLYLNVFTTVGYGSKAGQQISDGELVYIYGGGLGYYLFDSAAFVLNFGSDKSERLFFNVSIMSTFELQI